MDKQILEALLALDPNNEDHWTADGLPKVDIVSNLVGETVTRQQITQAKPGFSKALAVMQQGQEQGDNAPKSNEPNDAENGEQQNPHKSQNQHDEQNTSHEGEAEKGEQVQTELEQIDTEIASVEHQVEALKTKLSKLYSERDKLVVKEERSKSNENPIRQYLEAQKGNTQQTLAQQAVAKLIKEGVSRDDLVRAVSNTGLA